MTDVAESETLTTIFSSPLLVNGVTTAGDRMFGVSQGDTRSGAGGTTPQLIEIVDGDPVAYPDLGWSSWTPGQSVEGRFVALNSIRVGPDGILWAVDRGTPAVGQPRVPGGPRLIGFDLATDDVSRIYDLGDATTP